MTKTERNTFLRNRGTLIRRAHDKQGQPIIKARTSTKDWHTLQQFDSMEVRDKTFEALVKYQGNNFKSDED